MGAVSGRLPEIPTTLPTVDELLGQGLDDQLIDDIFRVNWRGPFAAVRAFRNLLAAHGDGLVINISSIAGVTAMGSNVAYCASKAALDRRACAQLQ